MNLLRNFFIALLILAAFGIGFFLTIYRTLPIVQQYAGWLINPIEGFIISLQHGEVPAYLVSIIGGIGTAVAGWFWQRLQSVRSAATTEITQMQGKVTDANTERLKVQDELGRMSVVNTSYKSTIQSLETTNSSLLQQNENLKQECTRLRMELQQVPEEVNA